MNHMCDLFWQSSMDRGRGGGDLVDIIRSVSGRTGAGNRWRIPNDDDTSPENFPAGSFADTFRLRGPLPNELAGTTFSDCGGGGGGGGKIQNPVNVFSRLAQISPAKHSALSQRTNRPVVDHAVQIPSLPNVGTTKRRKNQVKKVVCIPAPTAANSKASGGEVVPSDLWAWRKYGQKPIKGSPYPRGYYRCSSSKGCSARKQVERSRSDPNMLVITYASEHNHPWPTQRNALAGSTRSSSNPNKNRRILPSTTKNSKLKAEPKDVKISSSSLPSTMVKEELMAINDDVIFDRLVFYGSNDRSRDFFADLAELESEPNEGVDPFANVFDWDGIIFGDD